MRGVEQLGFDAAGARQPLGNADVVHVQLADERQRAGADEAELGERERDRVIGAHRRADDAAIGVDARRHVDGEHRAAMGAHAGDGVARAAGLDRSRQAGAEERVDDDVVAMEQRGRRVGDLHARALGGVEAGARIARDLAALTDERDGHFGAARVQMASDDEAIAAVVAGAAEGDDARLG